MKKLSRKALIFITVGVVVVVAGSLGILNTQLGQDQEQLNQELEVAKLRLDKHPPGEFSQQIRELEWRTTQLESQVNAAKYRLIQTVESIEITDTVFQVAEDYEVEIVEIKSLGVDSEDLSGYIYTVLLLSVKAEGSIPSLVDYIFGLSRKLPTGVFETVKIEDPSVVSAEAESVIPSATINLRIYSYQGE